MVMEEEQSHMELASESVPVPQIIISNELRNNEEKNEIATPKKKPRLRKKALHAAVRKQMEFYFGDANLSKDRFLGNLIKQDPYVELQVFLRFNKIRSLTTDVNQIVRALQKSEMLSVSEDGSRVCRITPISQKENIEECSIYVQRLPLNADHEWLSSVFSQYGPVSYVSIPRYKSNKRIKGFAFVEFEDPSSAVKCLEAFREKSCVLPSQTSPDSLLSITTFHEEEMMEKQQRKQQTDEKTANMEVDAKGEEVKDMELEVQTEETNETIAAEQEQDEMKTAKKRKYKESEICDGIGQDSEIDSDSKAEKRQKKLKLKNNEDEKDEGSSKSNEKISVKKLKHKGTEEGKKDDKDVESKAKKRKSSEIANEDKSESSTESSNRNNQESADSEKEKKGKKRKQRSASTAKSNETPESGEEEKSSLEENNKNLQNEEREEVFNDDEDQKKKRKRKRHNRAEKVDTADIGMQIMAKRDWKTLRNKYLQLQRSKMKSLKTHLKRAKWNQRNKYEKFRESDKSKAVKDEGKENTDDQKDEKSTQRFVFTPGVIVRVEMDEPCTDPKNFKMELKRNSNIKYIDVAEGASEAFLRCDTNEAAKALVLQSNEERSMSILQDAEETEYWNKMSKDREEKLGKKIRVKQRGRDKLLKKAEKELGKHIKFDEV